MTIREQVEKDGVGVRWFRTAVTTLVATGTLIGMMFAGGRTIITSFETWVDTRLDEALSEHRDQLDRFEEVLRGQAEANKLLAQNVTTFKDRLNDLARESAGAREPAWRFADTTQVSDGSIGGVVFVKAEGYKDRECGRPVIGLYFINGGGVVHQFQNISITDAAGRGVSFPADPDKLRSLTYTATIPRNDNVTPGRANAFIELDYTESCPNATLSRIGPLQFRIRDDNTSGRADR